MDARKGPERRRLVPSERERRAGMAGKGPPPRFDLPGRRRTDDRVSALRRYLREMDPRTLEGPKLPVIMFGLSALLAGWDDRALLLLEPEIRVEFGLSLAQLFALQAALVPIALALGPAMGYIADRVKRVWMLRVGGLLVNASSIAQAVAPGVPQLAAARAVGGLGGAIQGPAQGPLIADYYPSTSRTRAFSFLAIMGSLGTLAGALVAGFVAERLGWRAAVFALGVLATGLTLGYFLLREPVRGYQDRRELGASEQVASREQRPVSWGEAFRTAGNIRTLRRMWYASIFTTAASVGAGRLTQFYYAQEFGLGPQARSYITTLAAAAGILGLAIGGPLGDRFLAREPGKLMAAMGAVAMAQILPVLVLVLSENLVLSVAVTLPLDFASSAIIVGQFTLMSLVIPARMRGSGTQIISLFWLLPTLPSFAIGQLADTVGVRGSLLAVIPLAAIGGILLMSSTLSVAQDIRASRAASLAEEEAVAARSRARGKMLVCRDVDVAYGGVQVLFNVDFDVKEGEIVALLGANGAGKSTLLKAIAGVEHASNGAIFFDGQDHTHVPPFENAAAGVVFVPSGSAVFPTLSVRDNLLAAAPLYRDGDDHLQERIEEVLEVFPLLRKRLAERAGDLSGGEQRMLAIGQALTMRPRLLLIDELSLGLAPSVVQDVLGALGRIRARDTSIVIADQSVGVALQAAERTVFMDKGQILFDGPSAELLQHPELLRSSFLAGMAGSRHPLAGPHSAPGQAGEQVLEVRNVNLTFGGVEALRAAGVDLHAGEIVGVIGPNGAGKTSLFDVISGFAEPSSGTVVLGGTNVGGMSPDARARLGLARAFQDVRLFPLMTVRENVQTALEGKQPLRSTLVAAAWTPSARRSGTETRARADFLIELLSLAGAADKFLEELSTGTRRAVEIACLSAANPRVVLLDEPSAGLAQAEAVELGPLLTRLVRETGCGMLLIEHNLPLAGSVADRLIAMHLGEVIAEGSPREVLADSRIVSSYMGERTPTGGI